MWERDRNHPIIKQPRLAADSPVWLASTQQQQLNRPGNPFAASVAGTENNQVSAEIEGGNVWGTESAVIDGIGGQGE